MAYKRLEDIETIINEYANNLQVQINESVFNIADECKSKLKNETSTYKIRSGKYNKAWKVKKIKNKFYATATIYNSMNNRILENGHINRDGSRTLPLVHIQPVADYASDTFTKEVEQIIKKGK